MRFFTKTSRISKYSYGIFIWQTTKIEKRQTSCVARRRMPGNVTIQVDGAKSTVEVPAEQPEFRGSFPSKQAPIPNMQSTAPQTGGSIVEDVFAIFFGDKPLEFAGCCAPQKDFESFPTPVLLRQVHSDDKTESEKSRSSFPFTTKDWMSKDIDNTDASSTASTASAASTPQGSNPRLDAAVCKAENVLSACAHGRQGVKTISEDKRFWW